ncbi:hypothetical protein HMPREF0083_05181 [Aneurinibacillus aneurinilyticus ATCC 12856]|uniref:Uncharacterized protein n=1 Tax=Aneurinibacillus aneurinilyticus ATCC 12856 TaxID=649747 RepID=U1WE52_ANEAE|nr:hypothetical protein HMPREF0083_05181 [Aneurinibacillus aneurinilyticus ATCC 12856]
MLTGGLNNAFNLSNMTVQQHHIFEAATQKYLEVFHLTYGGQYFLVKYIHLCSHPVPNYVAPIVSRVCSVSNITSPPLFATRNAVGDDFLFFCNGSNHLYKGSSFFYLLYNGCECVYSLYRFIDLFTELSGYFICYVFHRSLLTLNLFDGGCYFANRNVVELTSSASFIVASVDSTVSNNPFTFSVPIVISIISRYFVCLIVPCSIKAFPVPHAKTSGGVKK